MATDGLGPSYSSMRAQNFFTDAVVQSESGSEWRVHKVILSPLGSFFFNAFSFPSFNGTLDLGVSDDVVQCIVDLAYEGVCNITVVNALETLAVALMYQLESLIKACIDFISANMMLPEHVFTVKAFVRLHQDALEKSTDGALTDTLNKWMVRNFSTICENEQIFELSYEELEAIVGKDDLNIEEEELMDFILKYIREKKLNREKATQLLANVRQVLINPPKLTQIIQENPTLAFEINKSRESYDTHRPRYAREIVIVIDDRNGEIGEVYDFRKNEWSRIEVNKLSSKFFKGGDNFVNVGNIIYCLKLGEEGWIKVKSIDSTGGLSVGSENLKFPAEITNSFGEYPMVVAWNGGLVAFMVYIDGRKIGKFYNPSEKSWSLFPMSEEVGSFSTIVVVNNFLFAIGGFSDKDCRVESRKIAYYDVESKAWSVCGSLKSVGGFNQAAVVEGKVYVFPDKKEGDGECFQPVLENGRMRLNWLSSIKTPWKKRWSFKMSAIDNKILFIGGDKDGIKTKECQMYSPRTGEWSVTADLNVEKILADVLTINLDKVGVERIEELCSGKILKSD